MASLLLTYSGMAGGQNLVFKPTLLAALLASGVLRATRLPGWYSFARPLPAALPPAVGQLRRMAFRPWRKFPAALRYANRLSDHLFVLGRHLNENGASDVLWVPGANR